MSEDREHGSPQSVLPRYGHGHQQPVNTVWLEFGERTLERLEKFGSRGDCSELKAEVAAANKKLDQLIEQVNQLREQHNHEKVEAKLMYVLKDDQADVKFQVTAVATDAEGHKIPAAKLGYEITSTDDSVVEVIPDDSDPPDPSKATAHFGAPGQATINVNISVGDKLLGVAAADFTVTEGDPASITEAKISFEGLSEVQP